ncbi:guanine nucleotide exchange factor Vps9 [Cordyceps fumosorosea ARSEF 2679]|uniref:Guanine nucleotide exchange factor Vps9 n=1 Tax=Cordyceps fumosorosea (strain ARSEF 2679) TaxID=1081104 RepID=A0A168DBG9_CORFA|nr:guanine nucleotide exchange factor Vps9 [Cordyceps fumosorosea ARSEF 2679]OAA72400.1 guanine nucleotide exchange factor Vps9 [Cordyceps fumosorosea ARSEF 2679]
MTAPEQPAGRPESPSQSPSEPVTQEPSTTHVEPKAADAAPPADDSIAKDAPSASHTPKVAEKQLSPTEYTPSDTAHVAEPTSETPAPTTPPAQTGSKMSQQLAAAAATVTKQRDDVTADAREDGDSMSASAITIRPAKSHDADASSQYLAPEPSSYVDPTPATPMTSQPTSRSPSNAARSHRSASASPSQPGADGEDKRYSSEEEHDGGSRSEIQSIMEQFSEHGGGPDADEVMSPRLEITSPMFGGPAQHPPRKSSLEPLSTKITTPQIPDSDAPGATISASTKDQEAVDEQGPPVPPKDGSFGTPPRKKEARGSTSLTSPTSPQLSMHRPPPPEPEPEPALPFDFYRFLEQLRNKRADPVARYLKSFLNEFSKRQWMVHEQVKIISDFLAFIANKMMLCEVWRDVSDAEFDNAREGMEKLVMNRLYSQTFSPAIPPPKPVPGARPKKRGGEVPLGSGRRGQHQEDVERDDIVSQKINIYGWIKPEHLDIPAIEESGRKFLKLAQQGLLKHNKSDSSADSFMPLLIYVVLQSNPEHLVSNVQYILRFRNQDRLGGEAGYYLSSLMGAVQFVENMDRTSLTISDDEFEQSVEAAVSAIAERNQALSPTIRQQATFSVKPGWSDGAVDGAVGGASASSPPSSTRPSYDGEAESSEGAAISGLLRTFQRPLTTIGRMFSDEPATSVPSSSSRPHHHPPPRSSQDGGSLPRPSTEEPPVRPSVRPQTQKQLAPPAHTLSAEEAAARQASAETAEAQRLQRAEHANVVETLAGMFPDLDKDVISDVVYEKEGRVGLAVDACLALSS